MVSNLVEERDIAVRFGEEALKGGVAAVRRKLVAEGCGGAGKAKQRSRSVRTRVRLFSKRAQAFSALSAASSSAGELVGVIHPVVRAGRRILGLSDSAGRRGAVQRASGIGGITRV